MALGQAGDADGRATMTDINTAVASYIAAWNETDADKRREVIARAWNEGGSYIDAHRGGTGHDAIDEMIAAVQQHLPGYRVRLSSGIEAHHGRVRFSWQAGGQPDAPLFIAGTDFATIAPDGRLDAVTGFVDAMPHVG
jgi:hypothetical protein